MPVFSLVIIFSHFFLTKGDQTMLICRHGTHGNKGIIVVGFFIVSELNPEGHCTGVSN